MNNPKINLIIEGLLREGKELKFERKSGLGSNPDVLKLSNGDEVQLIGMSYKDKGDKQKKLNLDDTMDQHYTEQFILKGVGGKSYTVTREVVLYKKDANVKGGLFQSKIVSVKENKDVNEARVPKYWDSMFAVKIIDAYKSGKLKKSNIREWEIDYNDGIDPKGSLNTKEIIDYYDKTGKEPGK